MRAVRLLRFELTVADLDAAAQFYAALPGVVVVERGQTDPAIATLYEVDRIDQVKLRRGEQVILLQQMRPPGQRYPADATACDQLFQHFALPVAHASAAAADLLIAATPVSRGGAQTLPATSGGATAYKFRDPDAHPLEFIQFADGHLGGIDHSAIVSADVERSIAFYRDELGFTVADRQLNHGPAQDRLDGLTGAEVDVVALAPQAPTPHIELLAYRSPPVKQSSRRAANDIAATRLVIAVDRVETPDVELADGTHAALVHDPDGHLLVLIGS